MPWPSGPVVVSTPEVRWYSGWPGAVGVQLAERLDVVHAHRGLAEHLVLGIHGLDLRQVQQRVQEHRGVPGRQHEAVAVRPDRIGGVEAQEALPQRVGDGGHRHRRPGVARVRLLDRVDRQRPDRVDAERVDVRCDRLGDSGHRCPILVQRRPRPSKRFRNKQDRPDTSRRSLRFPSRAGRVADANREAGGCGGGRRAGRGRDEGGARNRIHGRLPAACPRCAQALDSLRRHAHPRPSSTRWSWESTSGRSRAWIASTSRLTARTRSPRTAG